MKNFTKLTLGLVLGSMTLSASAADFVMPEPTMTVPKPDQEHLYDMIQFVWGYYPLTLVKSQVPNIQVIDPDGVRVVPGNVQIDDANAEGVDELPDGGTVPATTNNALSIRKFIQYDDDWRPIEKFGTYRVFIPAGTVLVNNQYPNEAVTVTFKTTGDIIKDYLPKAEYVYPATEFTSFVSQAQVTWGRDVTFASGEDAEAIEVTLYKSNGGASIVYASGTIRTVTDSGPNDDTPVSFQVLDMYLDDFITYGDGTLAVEFYIPEGLVVDADGVENDAQVVVFTLVPTIQGTVNPEDGAKLENGNNVVTVTWPGDGVMPNAKSSVIVRDFDTREDFEVPVTYSTAEDDAAFIKIDISSFTNGVYEVIIPDAFVLITGANNVEYSINGELDLTYTIGNPDDKPEPGPGPDEPDDTGVEGIVADGGVYNVFSVAGVKVLTTTNVEEVNALAPGLYIVNGHKVIIK